MKFRSLVAAALIGVSGMSLAYAAGEPQVVRQGMMKKVGGAVGEMAKMVKGETPYDVAVAVAQLQIIADTMSTYPDQFPVGSETGFESEAAPAIWTNMEDFKAKSAALQTAAVNGVAAAPADLDAFKAVFGPLTKTCGTCHETYRLKSS